MKLRVIFFAFLGLTFISCSGSKNSSYDGYVSEERFVDSLQVGEKGRTKVEFEKFRHNRNGDVFVAIDFYKRGKVWSKIKVADVDTWFLTNNFKFDKDGATGLDVNIKDFNNDGFNDVTYQSGMAGRGGNIVMTLFMYDPKNKGFIHIKNSERYPNLSFNAKLNCINSMILTGSTTTVFLKIKKDSLIEFARVDVSDSILVQEKDSTGKFKVIERKPYEGSDEDIYKPFRNYRPLEY